MVLKTKSTMVFSIGTNLFANLTEMNNINHNRISKK